MALQTYKGFLGPDAPSSSYMGDGERSVNCYMQPTESPSAPAPWVLLPTPGYTLLASVPQAPGRAMFSENGRNFFVSGFAFWEFFADGTTILRGTVAADADPATITGNGDAGGQLFITSADRGYCYDLLTNTLTLVLASGARMGAFVDGFFLTLDTTTSTFRISALLNGMVWPALQIAQRTAGSDRWLAMYVVNRLIYLLGSATSEVWVNLGTSPFPFGPIQEAFSQHGIAATFSGAVDTSLTFLGRNANGRGIFYRMNGYTPVRISTHAVEVAVQSYARLDDCVAGISQVQGRPCYIATFPDADKTHAFDEGTQLWHLRERWNPTTATAHASRSMFFASLPNLSVSCDRVTGDVLTIDPDVYTEADNVLIQRIRVGPRVSANQARFVVNRFQLVCDVGVGLNGTGQGSDPMAMLSTSRDGGKTYGHEQWTTLGKIGTFATRVQWSRLGHATNWVPKVVLSDPIPFRICDALLDITVGSS